MKHLKGNKEFTQEEFDNIHDMFFMDIAEKFKLREVSTLHTNTDSGSKYIIHQRKFVTRQDIMKGIIEIRIWKPTMSLLYTHIRRFKLRLEEIGYKILLYDGANNSNLKIIEIHKGAKISKFNEGNLSPSQEIYKENIENIEDIMLEMIDKWNMEQTPTIHPLTHLTNNQNNNIYYRFSNQPLSVNGSVKFKISLEISYKLGYWQPPTNYNVNYNRKWMDKGEFYKDLNFFVRRLGRFGYNTSHDTTRSKYPARRSHFIMISL